IRVADKLGRIQVPVPEGREQGLLLRFEDTWPRIVGKWLSVISLLVWLVLIMWHVRGKRIGTAQDREG
ncbi:MAG: hypothetical protein M1132_02455, partial [Chloroflexi bacterium]|nr:hypothetical protein [Chloroflexota bacterium]